MCQESAARMLTEMRERNNANAYYREAARQHAGNYAISVSPTAQVQRVSTGGAWVQAHIWVPDPK